MQCIQERQSIFLPMDWILCIVIVPWPTVRGATYTRSHSSRVIMSGGNMSVYHIRQSLPI